MSALERIKKLVDLDDPYRQAPDDLAELQIDAVRELAAQRRKQIKVLDKRATDAGIGEIRSLHDLVPLLFSHTTFKSYPENFIDDGRWSHMNLWLQTLSTRPVTGVDVKDIRDIDDWVARLHQAGHYVFTSSGTSGKCSFMNHNDADMDIGRRAMATSIRNSNPAFRSQRRPVFVMMPRYGSHRMIQQVNDAVVGIGEEGEIHYLSDQPATAGDVRRISRMRRAIADGTAKPSEIAAFEASMAERQKRVQTDMQAFLDKLFAKRKEPTYINGMWSMLWAVVEGGRARGLAEGDFHPDTVITIGGGLKGARLPADFMEQAHRFFGIAERNWAMTYGMVEMTGTAPWSYIAAGYHLPPWIVPLILDKNGEKLLNPEDRRGEVEGRMAFVDVLVEGRWGGIITGDKVSVDFSPGKDGLKVPIVRRVARYQDLEEGEDKLSCAGTMEAYVHGMVEV